MLLGTVALICTALIASGKLGWRTICAWWKSKSKMVRQTIVVIIVVIPLCFVAIVLFAIYQNFYGKCYWPGKQLSKDVCTYYYRDNMYRVYNCNTGEYTTPKINWISSVPENDSLAVYALPKRRGYLNVNTGEICIDAKKNEYEMAWVFSEGVGAVVKKGMIGFINAKNEVVIPFQFKYSESAEMNVDYLFHNGTCIMLNKYGKCGLIDTAGKWVVNPIYDQIWVPMKNGKRVVISKGKFGLLDASTILAFPVEYNYIGEAKDGNGLVLVKNGQMWQVDNEGSVVNPFLYDDSYWLNYPSGYSESGDIVYTFAQYAKYRVLNSYGVMNRFTGKVITPALYSDINMLSEDLFEVKDYNTNDWHLLDSRGEKVSN